MPHGNVQRFRARRVKPQGETMLRPKFGGPFAFSFLAAAFFSVALSAQEPVSPVGQPPLWASRPDVAAFERIENERLASAQRFVDQIVTVNGPRTIENTLVPYDAALAQIIAGGALSGLMQQVHPDAAFRDEATAMTVKISAANTALSLNRAVYQALVALDLSSADP